MLWPVEGAHQFNLPKPGRYTEFVPGAANLGGEQLAVRLSALTKALRPKYGLNMAVTVSAGNLPLPS